MAPDSSVDLTVFRPDPAAEPPASRPVGPSRWTLIPNIRYLIFFIVMLFVSYLSISRFVDAMFIHPAGRAPAEFSVEGIARDYSGQTWLTIDGIWAMDHAWISPEDERSRRMRIDVPVVPENWHQHDAIHVVAIFSVKSGDVDGWLKAHTSDQRQTFTGTVAPSKGDYDRIFPSLTLAEKAVVIYAGQSPSSDSQNRSELMLGLVAAIAATGMVLRWLIRIQRDRRERRD